MTQGLVIIGASHAGVALAAALRQAGDARPITLISDEEGLPYHRPHTSKDMLAATDLPPAPLRPAAFYDDNAIIRLHARVTAIDRQARLALLADGRQVAWDHLVLATGARARPLPEGLAGHAHARILRHAEDARMLTTALGAARRIAIIGAGLIGLEVAAMARMRGLDVTVIETANTLMQRSLYPAISRLVRAHHENDGIAFVFGATLAKLDKDGVSLGDGRHLPADLILAAIGSLPETALAQAAGLPCDNGISCDEIGRTADPQIFAMGDCASWPDDTGAMTRHESVAAATWQAKVVAATLTGQMLPPQGTFKLWSDQGGLRVQMAGPVMADARIDIQTTAEQGSLLTAHDAKNVLRAVQALNAPRSFNSLAAQIGTPALMPARS